jgi:hypothetical protein
MTKTAWIDSLCEWTYEDEDIPAIEPREYLDDAVVGVAERWQDGTWNPHLVYDYGLLLEGLAKQAEADGEEDPYEAAMEWYSTNTYNAIPNMGPNQPSIIVRPEEEFSGSGDDR